MLVPVLANNHALKAIVYRWALVDIFFCQFNVVSCFFVYLPLFLTNPFWALEKEMWEYMSKRYFWTRTLILCLQFCWFSCCLIGTNTVDWNEPWFLKAGILIMDLFLEYSFVLQAYQQLLFLHSMKSPFREQAYHTKDCTVGPLSFEIEELGGSWILLIFELAGSRECKDSILLTFTSSILWTLEWPCKEFWVTTFDHTWPHRPLCFHASFWR